MRVLSLSVFAAVVACGGGVKKPTGPSFTKGQKVRISDGGQIYDGLNTTTCIAWPSPEVKHRAGKDGWNGWDPDTGIEGEVIAQLAHCDRRTQVVLVEVAGYVVPVTSKGVEVATATPEGVDVGVEGGMIGGVVGGIYGGDPYGGDYYGGYDDPYYDPYGGYGTSSFYEGDSVRIISTGSIYTSINTTDCLTWPSEELKKQGGYDAWGSWSAAVDDVGVVVAISVHCDEPSTTVLILDVGGMIVPIQSTGVELYY